MTVSMEGGNTNAAYSKDNDEDQFDDINGQCENKNVSHDNKSEKDQRQVTEKNGKQKELTNKDNAYNKSHHAVAKGTTAESNVGGNEKRRSRTCMNVGKGVLVRLCLLAGNAVAVWRTTSDTGYTWPWALTAVCVAAMAAENVLVIRRTNGGEWTWWSPCIMIYLVTTLPAVWLIQLNQREVYMAQTDDLMQMDVHIGAGQQQQLSGGGNHTTMNQTSAKTTTPSSVIKLSDLSLDEVLDINTDTWVIIVGESLIYLIVFARWFLPRGDITREFLADMLLEFLAIASDIMELLAIFDIHEIRANLHVTLWILSIWSLSFIQFIPVLMHKRKYLHVKSPHVRWIMNIFGDYFVEIVITCMSIFLQDGPFLALRLYVMIKLDRITYSLVFFVFKNIVSLFLLFYRLTILFSRLPVCCCAKRKAVRRARTVEYVTPHSN